jgi:hypothetical protein
MTVRFSPCSDRPRATASRPRHSWTLALVQRNRAGSPVLAGSLRAPNRPNMTKSVPFDQGTLRSLMVWRVRRQGLEP